MSSKFYEMGRADAEDMGNVDSFEAPMQVSKVEQAKQLVQSEKKDIPGVPTFYGISPKLITAVSRWFEFDRPEVQVGYYRRKTLDTPESPREAAVYYNHMDDDTTIYLKNSHDVNAFLALIADSSKVTKEIWSEGRWEPKQITLRVWSKT